MRDDQGRQHYEALGASDDARDADGLTVFSFAQAQKQGREFFKTRARAAAGDQAPDDRPCTVERAIEDYFVDQQQRGSKGVRNDRYAANARILPVLGSIEVAKLSAAKIKSWRQSIETGPKLIRSKKGAPQATAAVDLDDEEAVRSRKSTSNRLLTVLKAALNHAFASGKVASDEAWR